jgi:hypothetical protein
MAAAVIAAATRKQTLARLHQMYAAVSMTNEAILRAKSASQLYQGVCDAAVRSGRCVSAAAVIPEATGWAAPRQAVTESFAQAAVLAALVKLVS